MIFDSFTIKDIEFKNRILRSSMGGRTAYYDGTVTPAWVNFERRFAEGGIAGIISATIDIDNDRLSPLEYPKLSHDRFIKPMREGVRAVQSLGCRYIMQIGDAGGHTQMSLLPQAADAKSASSTFDLIFGYRNQTTAMTRAEIESEIMNFGEAARRVREIGCDGIEVTASKGYLIHQFLNPATNRRNDEYGGTIEKRFRLLREVVEKVREKVGEDFLFGIRLSAVDYNYLPVNIRLPIVFPLRHYFMGNGLNETLYYGQELEKLGVDYLHIDSGFGFINPKGNPGAYPIDGVQLFLNYTRHLSAKARIRSALVNLMPTFLARAILGAGWKFAPAANADFARRFKEEIKIPVIANGGFQRRDVMEDALQSKMCDMIAIARPLLANRFFINDFQENEELNEPDNPCTFCNRCCTRTAVQPLGCYEPLRFASQAQMEQQIIEWSGTPFDDTSEHQAP
jgi:2,4-dienoyl-CoA reductase-like NADH-dependent reductase (Old Yellow Enzyme family)